MKVATSRQLTNAIAAAQAGKGQVRWIVRNSYESPCTLRDSQPMTYREAAAFARMVRDGGGWAEVKRIK